MMTWLWSGMVVLSVLFGLATGQLDAVSEAALSGASSAVELSLTMAGVLCLWSGVMEIMNVCGISGGLARLFRPLLRRLLPQASRDSETLAAVSANVSANLLGLGNAATPLGIQAARRMARVVTVLPATSCVYWWCSTPPPSSCCRPPSPLSGRPPDARRPLISCRRCGCPRRCPWRQD